MDCQHKWEIIKEEQQTKNISRGLLSDIHLLETVITQQCSKCKLLNVIRN
jgi:hypothetical protein